MLFKQLSISDMGHENMPLLVYGIERADTINYITHDSLTENSVDLHAASIKNLEEKLSNLSWQEIRLAKYGIELRYLVFMGDFNAAECLLLKGRMLEAHELLMSKKLLACTPQRGLLLVLPYPEQSHHNLVLKIFSGICEENYSTAENEQISPRIWVVEDGVIKEPWSEQSCDDRKGNAGRYYFPMQVAFMTLFGTLLAGFYAMAVNFKRLGMRSAYKLTIFCTVLAVPAAIYIFSIIPRTGYDRLFPVFSAFCLGLAAFFFQSKPLKIAVKIGARRQTIAAQIFVIASSLLILLIVLSITDFSIY